MCRYILINYNNKFERFFCFVLVSSRIESGPPRRGEECCEGESRAAAAAVVSEEVRGREEKARVKEVKK